MKAAPTPEAARPIDLRESFLEDVIEGLTRAHKRIPSKYLYDRRGSAIFDRICELDEYYLTDAEQQILHCHAQDIARTLGPRCLVIEYGSGSGNKIGPLLDALEEPAGYVPIDISHAPLNASVAALRRRHPGLEVLPLCADYTADYHLPTPRRRPRRKVVFFPGSTIGNFVHGEARAFLSHVAEVGGANGGLLIGVDVEKDRDVIERAYDDAEGVTAAFNYNLIDRINRELGAELPVDAFRYRAFYNRDVGRVEMYLICQQSLSTRIGGAPIELRAGEPIHTEYSYKYRLEDFARLARAAGLDVRRVWQDDERLFSVQYLEPL